MTASSRSSTARPVVSPRVTARSSRSAPGAAAASRTPSPAREGSYFIVVFDAPSEAIDELERSLNITEEVMRHLVTRIERPAPRRPEKADEEAAEAEAEAEPEEAESADTDDAPPVDDEPELEGEIIDESESEAAPKAV